MPEPPFFDVRPLDSSATGPADASPGESPARSVSGPPRDHPTAPPRDDPATPNEVTAARQESSGKTRQETLFETEPPPWELTAAEDLAIASIVFSEAPHGPYDYRIPDRWRDRLHPGMRVRVPLGKRRQTTAGWCIETKFGKPASRNLREVAELIDEEPLCDPPLVRLVLWMSHYYQAPAGQVFDTLIPSGVRSAAGTRERVHLRPADRAKDPEAVAALPVKQRSVIQHLIAAGRALTATELKSLAECTDDPIRRLRSKGWLVEETRRVMSPAGAFPASVGDGEEIGSHELTAEQAAALDRITAAIDAEQSGTLLLHGVTGSGKTEVYIRAIERVVRFGRGAIVLVPEISLTPQTRGRFERRFSSVAVLHSQMSPAERHYQWQRIRHGDVQVVVGARSAVFAPHPRLGLIILDEEHDGSFKQDSQPRYHARRVAYARAKSLNVPLLLGSATPSLESWHAAHSGHAELISMRHRIENRPLPQVQLVDLRLPEARSGGAISRPLHAAIRETLAEQGQSILLLNRRGFATTIQCPACGHVVACPDCDLPLTHHRDGSKAICHYCDYTIATPPWCPECRFDGIRYAGLGTQKLEAEVKAKFPDAVVARMDSDTMRRPGSHQRVLSAFRAGQIDLLLGTQMIAKGLDFPNVLLVGVVNADSALHFPDFRAAERTFQLVTQVAGRTGRGARGGRVIVQTFSPEHPAIQAAARHDYESFAKTEMAHRERFQYPPLGSLARIIVRGPEEESTEAVAVTLASRMEAARDALGAEVRILGPAPPPIARLRGKYRFHLLLQSTNPVSLGETIRRATTDFSPPPKEEIQFVVDIDPLDML